MCELLVLSCPFVRGETDVALFRITVFEGCLWKFIVYHLLQFCRRCLFSAVPQRKSNTFVIQRPLFPVMRVLYATKFGWCWAVKAVNGIHGPWRCAHIVAMCLCNFSGTFWMATLFFWLLSVIFLLASIMYVVFVQRNSGCYYVLLIPHSLRNSSEIDSCPTTCILSIAHQFSLYTWSLYLQPGKWPCKVGAGNLDGHLCSYNIAFSSKLF